MKKKNKADRQSVRFTTNWTIQENKDLEKEAKSLNMKKTELIRAIVLENLFTPV